MMNSKKGFTLVEIMIVVAIIGILIAIAVPGFLRAREISRRNACQENLTKIDGAKQQWALETRATAGSTPTWANLVGTESYLPRTPLCPGSGAYTIDSIGAVPTCSLSTGTFAHVYPTGS